MIEKKYLNIKEVSEKLNLKEYIIRHWDSKINGISTRLHENGNRYFNAENIKKLENLKSLLYENGKKNYTLNIADKILDNIKARKSSRIVNKNEYNDTNENPKKIIKILVKMRKYINNL
tara:strand:- start:152 stop:508 length:357 start_codon:yes stop_codon:yes gene_type:complete